MWRSCSCRSVRSVPARGGFLGRAPCRRLRQYVPGHGLQSVALERSDRSAWPPSPTAIASRLALVVLPRDYPTSVAPGYITYVNWTFAGLLSGRIQGVLATQGEWLEIPTRVPCLLSASTDEGRSQSERSTIESRRSQPRFLRSVSALGASQWQRLSSGCSRTAPGTQRRSRTHRRSTPVSTPTRSAVRRRHSNASPSTGCRP